MSTVQATASSTAATASSAVATKDPVKETEERFLKLLVTQMRNQDPLNPMDNAEVTTQMAQLNTVSGINKLNDSLSALSSLYQSSQSMQASSMIGHPVLAEGNNLDLKTGVAVGGIDLAGPADKVEVTIKDAAGNVLATKNLGSQKAGVVNFGWDGTDQDGAAVADGTYQFSVKANQGENKVTATTLSLGTVNSVTLGSQGVSLNVTGLGALSISQIKQIL
jgi:flagellar basal-body rod modification protein FlgD